MKTTLHYTKVNDTCTCITRVLYEDFTQDARMITVVGGIKGGGGKTTIATNLCVMRSQEGKKVLLVDADEQRTASDWASQRDALGIATNWVTIQLAGKSIRSEIVKMLPHYDDVIIDVGGRDTTSQRAAFSIAHKCLIPFKPKSFDMWTIGMVKTLISEAKAFNPELKAYALINQADSRGSDNDEALGMLNEDSDFTCIPVPIGHRKAFGNAAAEGLGIIELKRSDPKANEEMKILYCHVFHT
jgi:chromosome partitioning protein